MWIVGEWVAAISGKTFTTKNVSTGEILGSVPLAGKEDVDRAAEAARAAFPAWSEKTGNQRGVSMSNF